jgi:superfamily II DNA or RNA helicase
MIFSPAVMSGLDWRGLEVSTCRLMAHCGWKNVQDIARSGDRGADILAVKPGDLDQTWLVQVKAVSQGNYVSSAAIQQALDAQDFYRSDVVVIATNGDFHNSAYVRAEALRRGGVNVRLWNGAFLSGLQDRAPNFSIGRRDLRNYQSEISDKVIGRIEMKEKRSLFVVATGLGKTVIASSIAQRAFDAGLKRILVLCHAVDLAGQLQREFWAQISKEVPTRIFMDGEPPVPIDGINFGLYQTFIGYTGGVDPDAFDLVIVDEAHHALANAFTLALNHLKPRHLVGMTATPWRGDGESIEVIFGSPIAKVSLVDGMKRGFLATVDYRLMCDNINWEEVPQFSKSALSIRDLNKRLFLPQRDEAVIAKIQDALKKIASPRVAIFSPSVAHAEDFARKLSSAGIPCKNASVHDKNTRRAILMDFSAGKLAAITSVDVLNEGIDIPDINVIVFLRATHSRRIFIQQLGRGLRLSGSKSSVLVLDFVTDVRRLSAVMSLGREAEAEPPTDGIERVWLKKDVVRFSDSSAQKFVEKWLADVTDLEDTDDAQKLKFPEEV